MQKNLGWCVGKFAYVRGSTTPMHFMELRDICLDPALDMTLLVAMRVSRVMPETDLMDQQLADWKSRLAIDDIACIARAVLRARMDVTTIVEFYPRLGFVFEALKNTGDKLEAAFLYRAFGPEEQRDAFDMMHADDGSEYEYAPDSGIMFWHQGSSDLLIYNQNQAVRQATAPAITSNETLPKLRPPCIFALRVASAPEGALRTSIHGRTITLPVLDEVLELLRSQNPGWQFKYRAGFDDQFFLPPDQDVGLLLGYNSGTQLNLNGFTADVSGAARKRSRRRNLTDEPFTETGFTPNPGSSS